MNGAFRDLNLRFPLFNTTSADTDAGFYSFFGFPSVKFGKVRGGLYFFLQG